jgi:outer membrane protein
MISPSKLLACVLLAASPLIATPVAAAPLRPIDKVAVVEVQRVIVETTEGQRSKKELEADFTKNQSKLDRKMKDLQKKVEDLQAKAAMLSPQELQRRQMELMEKEQEMQQLYAQMQEELSTKEALLTEKIYKKVAAIVKGIALEEELQIVLVRADSTVLYVNPKLDLTNRVILAYDKAHP